jgi:hypothetical protein
VANAIELLIQARDEASGTLKRVEQALSTFESAAKRASVAGAIAPNRFGLTGTAASLEQAAERATRFERAIRLAGLPLQQLAPYAASAIQPVAGLAQGLSTVAATAGPLGVAGAALLAIAGGAIAATSIAGKLADDFEQLDNAAKRIGTSTQNIQVLQEALREQGLSADVATTALTFLSRAIAENNPLLKQLGITARDPYTAFVQLADVLSRSSDTAKNNAIAMKLMGRGVGDLLSIMGDLNRVLPEIRARMQQNGSLITDDMVPALRKLDSELDVLKNDWHGAWTQLQKDMLPTATFVAKWADDTLAKLRDVVAGVKEAASNLGHPAPATPELLRGGGGAKFEPGPETPESRSGLRPGEPGPPLPPGFNDLVVKATLEENDAAKKLRETIDGLVKVFTDAGPKMQPVVQQLIDGLLHARDAAISARPAIEAALQAGLSTDAARAAVETANAIAKLKDEALAQAKQPIPVTLQIRTSHPPLVVLTEAEKKKAEDDARAVGKSVSDALDEALQKKREAVLRATLVVDLKQLDSVPLQIPEAVRALGEATTSWRDQLREMASGWRVSLDLQQQFFNTLNSGFASVADAAIFDSKRLGDALRSALRQGVSGATGSLIQGGLANLFNAFRKDKVGEIPAFDPKVLAGVGVQLQRASVHQETAATQIQSASVSLQAAAAALAQQAAAGALQTGAPGNEGDTPRTGEVAGGITSAAGQIGAFVPGRTGQQLEAVAAFGNAAKSVKDLAEGAVKAHGALTTLGEGFAKTAQFAAVLGKEFFVLIAAAAKAAIALLLAAAAALKAAAADTAKGVSGFISGLAKLFTGTAGAAGAAGAASGAGAAAGAGSGAAAGASAGTGAAAAAGVSLGPIALAVAAAVALYELVTHFKQVGHAISKALDDAGHAIEKGVAFIGRALDSLAKALGKAVEAILNAVVNLAKGIGHAIGSLFSGIGHAIGGVIKGIGHLLGFAQQQTGGEEEGGGVSPAAPPHPFSRGARPAGAERTLVALPPAAPPVLDIRPLLAPVTQLAAAAGLIATLAANPQPAGATELVRTLETTRNTESVRTLETVRESVRELVQRLESTRTSESVRSLESVREAVRELTQRFETSREASRTSETVRNTVQELTRRFDTLRESLHVTDTVRESIERLTQRFETNRESSRTSETVRSSEAVRSSEVTQRFDTLKESVKNTDTVRTAIERLTQRFEVSRSSESVRSIVERLTQRLETLKESVRSISSVREVIERLTQRSEVSRESIRDATVTRESTRELTQRSESTERLTQRFDTLRETLRNVLTVRDNLRESVRELVQRFEANHETTRDVERVRDTRTETARTSETVRTAETLRDTVRELTQRFEVSRHSDTVKQSERTVETLRRSIENLVQRFETNRENTRDVERVRDSRVTERSETSRSSEVSRTVESFRHTARELIQRFELARETSRDVERVRDSKLTERTETSRSSETLRTVASIRESIRELVQRFERSTETLRVVERAVAPAIARALPPPAPPAALPAVPQARAEAPARPAAAIPQPDGLRAVIASFGVLRGAADGLSTLLASVRGVRPNERPAVVAGPAGAPGAPGAPGLPGRPGVPALVRVQPAPGVDLSALVTALTARLAPLGDLPRTLTGLVRGGPQAPALLGSDALAQAKLLSLTLRPVPVVLQPAAPRGGGGDGAMLSELRALRASNEAMRHELQVWRSQAENDRPNLQVNAIGPQSILDAIGPHGPLYMAYQREAETKSAT